MIPDNVEKIIMTKEDYDRNVEQLLFDKVSAELERDKYKEVLDKIKEYARELRLFDNESVEFEISNKILELLEEIE